jgi:hypothetical protein
MLSCISYESMRFWGTQIIKTNSMFAIPKTLIYLLATAIFLTSTQRRDPFLERRTVQAGSHFEHQQASPELGGTIWMRKHSLFEKWGVPCDFPISSGKSGLTLKPWDFKTDFQATTFSPLFGRVSDHKPDWWSWWSVKTLWRNDVNQDLVLNRRM